MAIGFRPENSIPLIGMVTGSTSADETVSTAGRQFNVFWDGDIYAAASP